MNKRVLNVGGNHRDIPLPLHYKGWEHHLLDIDPTGNPDIVCDAREMTKLPSAGYDAIHCSHNLEHYHSHELPRVLAGFLHVLKMDGFVEIRVPDLGFVIRHVAAKELDLEDPLYTSPAGPVLVRDVIYGFGREIERSREDFYAHKTGFTKKSLQSLLERYFSVVVVAANEPAFELHALALRQQPTAQHLEMLSKS
jgi:hypothetical protein